MATKVISPLPPIQGVAAGATPTIDVPVGPRYHTVWLRAKTTASFDPATKTISDVLGMIRVKLNGRVQRQLTAKMLNAIQALMGEEHSAYVENTSGVIVARVDADGRFRSLTGGSFTTVGTYTLHVPIFFAEPWRKEYAAGDMMAWPTSWDGPGLIATFQIDVNCGSSLAELKADGEWDFEKGTTVDGNPLLLISKINYIDVPVTAGTGAKININTLPRTDFYQQISVWASGGANPTVDEIQVKANGLVIRDVTRAKLEVSHWSRGMNFIGSSDPSRLDVVFDYDDVPSSALNMSGITDFQVIITYTISAGGTLSVLYQTYGPMS